MAKAKALPEINDLNNPLLVCDLETLM